MADLQTTNTDLDHRGERRLSGRESAVWYTVAAVSYIAVATWEKVLLTWFIGPMWLVATLTFGPRLYDRIRDRNTDGTDSTDSTDGTSGSGSTGGTGATGSTGTTGSGATGSGATGSGATGSGATGGTGSTGSTGSNSVGTSRSGDGDLQ